MRRVHEHNMMNLSEVEHLVDASGKQSLGGGVQVGITLALKNVQVAFKPDFTPKEIGTITTADTNGTLLIDSTALFETNGVEAGAWIVNLDDGSVTGVISVDSEIQLTTLALGGGILNQYTFGDSYKIWNVIQKEVLGANVTAKDDLDADISSIFVTPLTQPILTKSSGLTAIDLDEIKLGSYGDVVWYDENATGVYANGINYPSGNRANPVNSIANAIIIAQQPDKGFKTISCLSDVTLVAGDDITNFFIQGITASQTSILIETGAIVSGVIIEDFHILDGSVFDNIATLRNNCHIGNVSFFDGALKECQFEGIIIIDDGILIVDCWDGSTSVAPPPVIDGNNSGADTQVRGYRGDLAYRNINGGRHEINLTDGATLILEATVGGTADIRVTGLGKVTDLTADDFLIDTTELINTELSQLSAFENRVILDPIYGFNGTKFPAGTKIEPCNNIDDAISILSTWGLDQIEVRNTLTIDASDDISDIGFFSELGKGQMILTDGCITENTSFREIYFSGVLNGYISVDRCWVGNISNIGSINRQTLFNDSIFLGSFALKNIVSPYPVLFRNCDERTNTTSGMPLNINGADIDLKFARFVGALQLANGTHADQKTGVGFVDGGKINVLSSCTAGQLTAKGIGKIETDLSGVSYTVNTELLVNEVLAKVLRLNGENQKMSNQVYDSETPPNMTSATMTTYTDNTLTVVEEVYSIIAEFEAGTNKINSWIMKTA